MYLVISPHKTTSCRRNVSHCRWTVLLWKRNAWVQMLLVTVQMDCRALPTTPGISAEGWDARHGYSTLCHRRTAHALDELHTWDLGHKKGYRKAKPFYLKCLGVVQRWQRDNRNMKRASYLVISPHETTSFRRNVPHCRWTVLLWKLFRDVYRCLQMFTDV